MGICTIHHLFQYGGLNTLCVMVMFLNSTALNTYKFSVKSKGLVIHKQVKTKDKTEQRFGVVMTPLFLSLRT